MSDELVDFLLDPGTYPEAPSSVTMVETHISRVFLTDRHAYKLKKPVRFEFLDFSTVGLRQHWCEEEVRLNRRLAPEVYLQVVAVRFDPQGRMILDENESADVQEWPVVDWLVKMRRLPADRTLDELHRADRLNDADLGKLASTLASFYRHAAPAAIDATEYRREIERHVRANRAELLSSNFGVPNSADQTISAVVVKRIHAAQLQLLQLHGEMFDQRLAAGRVIDGHGDLRPEHIYLLPEPVIVDCIEFNHEFRQLDLADELSFLVTEFEFIGAPEVGRRMAEKCLNFLGDHPSGTLLAFYRSYRACVRAKVALLRARQLQGSAREAEVAEFQRHLELANRSMDDFQALARPLMFVVHGLPGSGKSTLAAALAEAFGAELLSTDSIRRRKFGATAAPADFSAGIYQRDSRMTVYDALLNSGRELLGQSLPVVLDGAFPWQKLRAAAGHAADTCGANASFVRCHCPPDIAMERIAKRLTGGKSDSETRPEFYPQQASEEEPPTEDENSISIDTSSSLEQELRKVIGWLKTGRIGR